MTHINFDFPKIPTRKLHEKGTFAVTGATAKKAHLFDTPEKLDRMLEILLQQTVAFKWQLEAWSLFSNHYHIMISSRTPENLDAFVEELHLQTAEMLNAIDSKEKRKVWSEYTVNKVIMQASHYAFLNFIHHNSVKHGHGPNAAAYRWCSASWFENSHDAEYVTKVKSFGSKSFGVNNVTIVDDFT